MKKQLLALVAGLGLLGAVQAQDNYYTLKSTGVSDKEGYDYKYSIATGTTAVKVMQPTADNVLSAAQSLPFSWNFMGQPVTQYLISDNGFITFNTTETSNPTTATALPSTSAPKNAIFAFWNNLKLASGSGVPDQIATWTYGTAPNRVHVIQWLSVTNAAASYASMAIRIYEGRDFDVVLNQIGSAITGTIGVNSADGTVGYNVAGSPSYSWSTPTADGDYANMTLFRFKKAPQPDNDVELTSLSLPKFSQKNTNIQIKGKVTNYGAQSLSSFRLFYSVGSGSPVQMLLSGLSIAGSGTGTYDFTHNIPYSNGTPGDYDLKVWVSLPNNSADGDSSNNNLTGKLTIVNSTVPRVVLHEIFTSATCPPCNPGNANLKSVTDQYVGKWNVIKYQVNFPGVGDPYYTTEVASRFSYYGASFAPWLTIDGSNEWGAATPNANSYNTTMFDAMAAVPSLCSINPTFSRTGQTVTVSGSVTPVQSFSNSNLKLRIAICEVKTKNNVMTNGETEFHNVMKKMLPNATGTAISFSAGTAVNFNQSFTFPGVYRKPADASGAINLATEHSVEEFGNLFAIVFVQDDNDKTVWQSATSAPEAGPLGVNEVNELGLTIYPNPATSSFNVSFNNASSSNGTVRILDINGKEVMSQNINSINGAINCDQLINGLYFVELTVDGKTAVKKMNIIR